MKDIHTLAHTARETDRQTDGRRNQLQFSFQDTILHEMRIAKDVVRSTAKQLIKTISNPSLQHEISDLGEALRMFNYQRWQTDLENKETQLRLISIWMVTET